MEDFLKAFFLFLLVMLMLLASPFFVAHVIDTWDAPIYPHSGFSPECPTWEEPANSLPPVSE